MYVKVNVAFSEEEKQALLKMREVITKWNCDVFTCGKCIFSGICDNMDSNEESFLINVTQAMADAVTKSE